jgi:hypothetical protein
MAHFFQKPLNATVNPIRPVGDCFKVLMGSRWIGKFTMLDGTSSASQGKAESQSSATKNRRRCTREINRILAGLKLEKNNAFEITRVTLKTLLGMPYISVSFHVRNIQESTLPLRNQTALPWKDAQIAAT